MPETARTRQDRAEGLYGGAPKRCYGKCWLQYRLTNESFLKVRKCLTGHTLCATLRKFSRIMFDAIIMIP